MQKITDTFAKEFGFLQSKFIIIEENLNDLANSKKDCVYHPGVYIHHRGDDIIKVGRHLTNSRKRALEHITSNTKNEQIEMKDLKKDSNSKVTLLNVRDPEEYHWVAAIEIYMENNLNPIIKSKRH